LALENERAERFKIGGPVDRVLVGLRIAGPDVDPTELERLLGVAPSHVTSRREVVCVFEAPQHDSIEDGVTSLLRTLPSDDDVWSGLTSRYRVDLFCGLFLQDANRGFVLSPSVLREVASRNIALGCDIYCLKNAGEGKVRS
jgi:hypothetical protein